MSLEKAAREAIAVLSNAYYAAEDEHDRSEIINAVEKLEAALAQQEKPEPVAWLFCKPNGNGTWTEYVSINKPDSPLYHMVTPLYTQPPRREWVGLTQEDIGEVLSKASMVNEIMPWRNAIIRTTEAKLKELNT